MAGSRVAALFFFAALVAVGAVGWSIFRKGAEPPAPVPPPPRAKTEAPPDPEPPPSTPEKKTPRKPADPPEPPIPSTPEGCLQFLRDQAGTARIPEGRPGAHVLDEVRCAALDAVVALDAAAAEPLVLQALGGDGDPTDWSSWRLHAAMIRIRAGKADGAETVKAYLASDPEPGFSDGFVAAVRAASWMAAADGAAVVHRLFKGGPDAIDEADDLLAILQAVATLGKGASSNDLKKAFSEEAAHDAPVLGAAAGALLRMGDSFGKAALDGIEEEDWADGAEFALGLGARGNEAVIPWLERMRAVEDEMTRAGAVRALGVVGTPATVALLRDSLKDADEDVRIEAAVALALRGEKDVLPLVRKAAESVDDDVAVRAWTALALAPDPGAKAAAERLLGEPSPGLRDFRREPALLRRIGAALLLCRIPK